MPRHRVEKAIVYLTNTDALGYVPEIRQEFIRVWNDAIESAAKEADRTFRYRSVVPNIRALKYLETVDAI